MKFLVAFLFMILSWMVIADEVNYPSHLLNYSYLDHVGTLHLKVTASNVSYEQEFLLHNLPTHVAVDWLSIARQKKGTTILIYDENGIIAVSWVDKIAMSDISSDHSYLIPSAASRVSYNVAFKWFDKTRYKFSDSPQYEAKYRVGTGTVTKLTDLPKPEGSAVVMARPGQRIYVAARNCNMTLCSVWSSWKSIVAPA
jgi:hypothetical protein